MSSLPTRQMIDFSLEVTNGCAFNCTGCRVDKDGNSWPTAEEFTRLHRTFEELDAIGFKPMNIQLGPTDLMTSINRQRIVESAEVQQLCKLFLKTAINCAFLDPFMENYDVFGKQLNKLLAGGMVKFVVPFEVYHIDNERYIQRIKDRIARTLSNMPDVQHTKTYFVVNYDSSLIYDKQHNTNITSDLVLKAYDSPLLEGIDVAIVLSTARADLSQPHNQKALIDSALSLQRVFAEARNLHGSTIDVAELFTHEGKDWDIFYKAGKLYLTPFLLEGLACFHPIFEVTGDWSADSVYNSSNRMLLMQLELAQQHPLCSKCDLVNDCADRGIHSLLHVAGSNECISPAKPLERLILWDYNKEIHV